MANIRNQSVYSDDHEYLQRLADELEWLGRGKFVDLNLREGRLTQKIYPPRKPSKKQVKEKEQRNKRAESAARHS